MKIFLLMILLVTNIKRHIKYPEHPNPPSKNIKIEQKIEIPKNCQITANQIAFYVYGNDGKWHFFDKQKVCIKYKT